MNMVRRTWDIFAASQRHVLYLYILVVLAVSLQQWFSHPKNFGGDIYYPDYNNFVIFKQSFYHLIDGKDLYQSFPQQHWDLFKYSPTFALLFAPLAVLPDLAGIILWTALNALVLFWGIQRTPAFTQPTRTKILLFVLIELITSLQNMQSNALIAGLVLLAFALLEEGNYFAGILCITCTVFIKIFGVLAFGILIFYPNKPRLILYAAASVLLFLLLPLVVVPVQQLVDLYASWWTLLSADHSAAYGLSMMGWLQTWFHLSVTNDVVVLGGLILLGLPLLWWKRYASYGYRIDLVSGLVVWLVILNHRAESPRYIIAACGAALWYFTKPRGALDLLLIVSFFIFTILSRTDIFPSFIQKEWFEPFVVKAVPAIFIWFRIVYESIAWRESET